MTVINKFLSFIFFYPFILYPYLCLTPNNDWLSDLWVNETFSTSEHSYTTFQFNLPISFQKNISYRDFENVNYELLRTHLAIIDWDIYFDGDNNDCNMLQFKFL